MTTTQVKVENTTTLHSTKPVTMTFREIATLMASPWTQEEIEELAMQEPLPPNQGFMLSADELSPDDNES